MSESIYLDHNATTPLRPAAREAMIAAMDTAWGNPSSIHRPGRAARKVVDQARESVAQLIGVEPAQVTFTSGATEGINTVIAGVPAGTIVATAVEHPAVLAAAKLKPHHQLHLVDVPAGSGVVPADFMAAIGGHQGTRLAVAMAANNVTGVINNVDALAPLLAARHVPFLVDATQIAGKMPVPRVGDYVVCSAHKLGGPKGVGALICRGPAPPPLIAGGGQEGGRRGGTEAVISIAGFGAAAAQALAELDHTRARLATLRDDLEAALCALLPGAWVVGRHADRLPNTCSLVLPTGVEAETVMARLNRRGIAVSAGSACTSGSPKPSRVLMASGLSAAECFRAIRISLGHDTTGAELDALLDALPRAITEARG